MLNFIPIRCTKFYTPMSSFSWVTRTSADYKLGMPELYIETNIEDPKAVLDGVAVAGLVGLLRQLSDLAEFAAEVFHRLQEQVLITYSRSHKLVERVHNIESALPPLEKAILGQTSHLHFAYTVLNGILDSEPNKTISYIVICRVVLWTRMKSAMILHVCTILTNLTSRARDLALVDILIQLISKDLQLDLMKNIFKVFREKKKKRYSSRYRDVTQTQTQTHGAPVIMHGERTEFGSLNLKENAFQCQDISTIDVPQTFGVVPEVDHLTSCDSRNGSNYIACIFHPSCSTQSEDNNVKELSYVSNVNQDSYVDSASYHENFYNTNLAEDSRSMSTYITWDEKLEIIDSKGRPNESTEIPCATEKMDTEVMEDLNSGVADHC